jgi:hypothetical protein
MQNDVLNIAVHLMGSTISKINAARLLSNIEIGRKFDNIGDIDDWKKYCINYSHVCAHLNPPPENDPSDGANHTTCDRKEFLRLALKMDPVRGSILIEAAKVADRKELENEEFLKVTEVIDTQPEVDTENLITTIELISLLNGKYESAIKNSKMWISTALAINNGRGKGQGKYWDTTKAVQLVNDKFYPGKSVRDGALKDLNKDHKAYSFVLRAYPKSHGD